MNWTEPKPPKRGESVYNHITCETPLGQAIIEWKGWKESDSYSVTIGSDYIGEGFDLEDAKIVAMKYLIKKHKALSILLGI